MKRWIITTGSIAGALVAIISAIQFLPIDRPAWSSDIKRLNRSQAEYAVELYSNKVRSIIVTPKPTNEPNATLWTEELDRAKRQLDSAERQRIELSK